jgi:hypothetical protein
MRKEVVLYGILFLLCISFAFASCSDDQVIMRLYQVNNSHVALWNHTLYSVPICYSDIFGKAYLNGNPHDCMAGNANTVIWLSAINNSHVATAASSAYNTPVCYGDLVCVNTTDSVCSADYMDVIHSYSNYNSHVSNFSDINYPIKICCKSNFVLNTFSGNMSWLDMNGINISSTDMGDDVVLFFGNDTYGKSTSYVLYNSAGVIILSSSTTRGFAFWNANASGTYYFNVSVGGSWKKSAAFSVGASTSDSGPSAVIKNTPGLNYSVGYNINFTQESHDQDDLLNLTWNFSDGNNVSFYSYSLFEKSNNSLLGNSAHAYTLPGKYLVKLTATERNRSAYDVDSFDVLIFGPGVNVIPVITSPERMKAYGSRWIYANASQTYVVNCSVGPMPNYNFTTIDGGLYCKYIHAPGAKATSAAYNLTFTWTMGDGRTTIGDLDSNYNTAVVFKYKYESSGLHSIGLNVRYIAL